MPFAARRRLLVVAACTVPVGATIALNESISALIVPPVLAGIALVVLCQLLLKHEIGSADYQRVVQWTMGAFVAHFLFGFAVTNTPQAVHYLGGDAGTYHTYAQWLMEFGEDSLVAGLQSGKEGWYYTLSALYKVFGPHPVVGLALNAALGAALVPIVWDTTRRLFGDDAAWWVPPIVVLFPSVFLFTSQLLKEAPILFLFSVALNASVRAAERLTVGNMVVLGAAVTVLLTFRGPIALVGGVGLIAGIALGKREVLSGLTTGLVVLTTLVIVVIFLGVGSSGVRAALESSNLEEAQRIRAGLAYDSQSAIGAEVDTTTTGRALSYLPVALARFAVGPFPWEVRGLRQLPLLVDVLVLWYLLPFAWAGLKSAYSRLGRRVALIAVPAGAISVVLALSVGNLGILVRERMQVYLLVAPLLALGFAVRRGDTKEKSVPLKRALVDA